MSRYIAITDIHGELEKLESVLSKIETRPDDIFVFISKIIELKVSVKITVNFHNIIKPAITS